MIKIYTIISVFTFIVIGSCSSSIRQEYVIEKSWGEFGDKPGFFKFPAMIASDESANIYVVDQHNHRIQKFDKKGRFILMWGKRGDGPGEFNFPFGIAIDSKGLVYVSDMNNSRIQKFTAEGEFILSAGSYGNQDGEFKHPYGLAIDEKDVLYVIDAFNYRIQKFDTDLRFLSKWGDQESIGFRLYMPHELTASVDGNIILSDRQNHRISFFTPDGALIKRLGEFGEGKEQGGLKFSEPHGVATDRSGNLFICDRYNFRIKKFNSSGEFQSQWYTSGLFDNSKHFPLGITISDDGNIYVTDHYAHCVHFYITR